MGAKMLKYYELVQASGGLRAKMRLAMKTGVPSAKAPDVPDSPDVLEKFYQAARELAGPSVPRL